MTATSPAASTPENFAARHIGLDSEAVDIMLGVIGVSSLDELAAKALPAGILDTPAADGIAPGLHHLPPPAGEHQALAELRELAGSNTVAVSMIGQGYYDTLTPPVLVRNILENPAWYTAYTPYQPEISQGRLEAVLNFQTMVADLTALDIANASMLDEATAAAEAMALMYRASRGKARRVAVDVDLFTPTAAVLATRVDAWNRTPDVPVGAVYLQRLPDGSVRALTVPCPHAGCFVDYKAARDNFHCPCHNSSFALDGRVLDPKSPSPRPLDSLETEVRGGTEVWVRFRNFRAGVHEKIPV